MMNKLYNIEASVHKQINTGYRVKVSLLDFGMYINGAMVFPPNPEHADWAVYMPAQRAGRGKYAYIVEFNKKLPLWSSVYDACIKAVELELTFQEANPNIVTSTRSFYQDIAPTDIDDEPIDLSNIPFD